jgi:hypothetical protein
VAGYPDVRLQRRRYDRRPGKPLRYQRHNVPDQSILPDGLPVIGNGFAFVVDFDGAYLLDFDGAYIITETA